jgi:hypothetical protein
MVPTDQPNDDELDDAERQIRRLMEDHYASEFLTDAALLDPDFWGGI